jgi:serine/threonine protein phosphatase PrpC
MSQSPSLSLNVSVAMDTDIGRRRKQNQDAIGHMIPPNPEVLAKLGQIFVLADGVGGLAGGDLASQYAVSTIISSYYEQEEGEPPDRLARAIAEANTVIYAEGQELEVPQVMATTVVVAIIRGRDLIIGSVGDSPAYLMRDALARKLTLDHTVEAMRREAGTPLPEDDPSGRKLVRALGSMQSVKVDIISGMVRAGDHVVLCSDGLTRYVPPEEIEQTVATLPPTRAVKALINMANERGGSDNISVIVLRLGDDSSLAQSSVPPLEDDWTDKTPAKLPPLPDRTATPVIPARERASSNPLRDLFQLARSNAVITGIGMGVLLVLFVIIMLILSSVTNDQGEENEPPAPTAIPAEELTATAALRASLTADANAALAQNALDLTQAAQLATEAILTLTPPPPSGPQMKTDDWFRILPGDEVPTFADPAVDAESATPLEAGSAYLIQEVNTEAWNGPWYWVVDNQGSELRWVNGPSLHERVLLISSSGDPLPESQQPEDIPPGVMTPTRSPAITPTPTGEITGTPDATLSGTPDGDTPTEPAIAYGVEEWTAGTTVVMKANLTLCQTPSVTQCTAGGASTGETGTIVDGPRASGEHWWWRVQFEGGRAGWIAQVLLGAP